MRLGFAVKVLGQPGLKSNDTRRWQSSPHMSVSLAYLRDILVYLQQARVRMYRMSSDLAPYLTHPDMPQFHRQVEECTLELAAIGQLARQNDIRLSVHPAAHVVLDACDEQIAAHSAADLVAQANILDRMELGLDAVIVTHVGGLYGNKEASLDRFAARYEQLPESARRRLVLENDERAYTIGDTYRVYQQTGIRLVLDQLHYFCNPTPGLDPGEALRLALSTWPEDQTPKIHFSTPCTALGALKRDGQLGRAQATLREPSLTQHADLLDPFSFIDLLRLADGCRDFDVMLECKAKDIALLRLRRHLARLAPDLVASRAIS